MNKFDEYYVPEKIEDESLRSVVAKVKNVLKENDILEDILKKYILAYNKTSKEGCSAKSLQVMHQNHKPIFSTISTSGIKKSLSLSSVGTEKSTNVPTIHRISSSTERKRLSFDIEDNKCLKPEYVSTEDSEDYQITITSPTKDMTSISDTDGGKKIRSCFTLSPFGDDTNKVNLFDGCNGRFNNDRNSYLINSFSNYDANLSNNIPYEDQTMVVNPEVKNRTPVKCIDGKTRSAWYLENRQSLYTFNFAPIYLNYTDKYVQERYDVDGKPETLTSSDIYGHDNEFLSPLSPDNQVILASPETKNNSLVNSKSDDKKSDKCLAVSPSFISSKKETKISDEYNLNEKGALLPVEKHETVSILTINNQETSCILSKTPDETQSMAVIVHPDERTDKKPTLKITLNQEFITPKKEVESSFNTKMIKRKSDHPEEAMMNTSLVAEDQDFVLPKMSKIDITMDSKNVSVKNSHVSFNSTGEFLIKDKNYSRPPGDSAMEVIDSINRPNGYFIDEQEVSHPDDKNIMDETSLPIDIKNKCEVMAVYPAKLSERTVYQASTTQDRAYYFSPEEYKKKSTVDDKYDIENSKNESNKFNSTLETKDFESLTNIMKNLSPSVKRSSDGTFNKPKTTESINNETTFIRQLRVQENQSKTPTSTSESSITKIRLPKPDNIYAIQAEKFIETLKQTKTRLNMYLHLFVEDQHDLGFIHAFILKLALVIEKIPIDQNKKVLIDTVYAFGTKGLNLIEKAYSWKSFVEKDIDVWEDCIQKVKQLELDIKHFCREKKQDITLKDLQKWEASFKIVNKVADDMTLLREIRRPTVLQFVYKLENLIKLFIQSMLSVGLLKRSSKVSSV